MTSILVAPASKCLLLAMLACFLAEVQRCASASTCSGKDVHVEDQCPDDVDESSTGPEMALLQAKRQTQRGHAVDHEDAHHQPVVSLHQMTKGGLVENSVQKHSGMDSASGAPCTCQASSANWTKPAPRAPRCLFIDLGAADGNTFRDFAANKYGPVQDCPSGGAYAAVLVEANPHFNESLARVHSNHPKTVEVKPSTAAYMCEGTTSFYLDTVTVEHNYWGSSLSTESRDVKASGGQTKVTVPLVNVARLLVENALPEDYVIVKMDIEGAEWDIIPCLANAPETVKLIDAMYVEKHPIEWSLSNKDQSIYDGAVLGLTQQGVSIPEYFSDTL